MLTSRHAVYLTGDFRFVHAGGRVEDDLLAQKLVPVVKFEWCALVAFCGVARTSTGLDVGDWISGAVQVVERREPIDALIKRLQTADDWLSRLRGNRRLSISVVGFRGRRPFAFLLSNFENLEGKAFPNVLPRLRVQRLKPKNIELRVFGDSTSVSAADRRSLKNMLQSNQLDPLKKALGESNMRASQNSRVISPGCVVGCLLPTGGGEIMVHGIVPNSEYVPRFVQREFESGGVTSLECKTDPDGERLNPHWRGMTIKVQGKVGKGALFATVHAMRNVQGAIVTKKVPNTQVFQKIAGPDEPERYTFHAKTK